MSEDERAALGAVERDLRALAADLRRAPTPGVDIAAYERRVGEHLVRLAQELLALSEGDSRQH